MSQKFNTVCGNTRIYSVLLSRVCRQRPDLLSRYGDEAVIEAVDTVAAFVTRHKIPTGEFGLISEMIQGRLAIKF